MNGYQVIVKLPNEETLTLVEDATLAECHKAIKDASEFINNATYTISPSNQELTQQQQQKALELSELKALKEVVDEIDPGSYKAVKTIIKDLGDVDKEGTIWILCLNIVKLLDFLRDLNLQ